MTENDSLTEQKMIIISMLILFSILIFCVLIIIDFSFPHKININNIDNKNLVNWNIESIQIAENYITIRGWAFIPGEETTEYDISIVLNNLNSGDVIELPTQMVDLDDLNNKYSDELNYANNGFFAKINKDLIKFDKNTFAIYIKYFNNGHRLFIRTNKIIGNN